MAQRSAADDLRFVLDFSAAELEPLSLTELTRWRDQVWRFTKAVSGQAQLELHLGPHSWMWFPGPVTGIQRDGMAAALEDVQGPLRKALVDVQAGRPWSVPAVSSSIAVERGRVKRVIKAHDGTPKSVFLAAVADLMVAGWESVNTCLRCKRLFVPTHGLQKKYCSAECGRAARWERFAPTRERDYGAEYERRQRARTGKNVRINKRRPRA